MKFRFILVSLFFGFSVYSLLNLFWGPCGLQRMYQLADYRTQVREDIRKLESTSSRFQAQIKLLAMNKDFIDTKAMELGYLEPNQGIIYLDGYSPDQKEERQTDFAQVLPVEDSPQNLLRGISLSVSAVLILLFYLFSLPVKKDDGIPDVGVVQ